MQPERLYWASCRAFVAGLVVAVIAVPVTWFGGALTGAGHGSYTLLWVGMLLSISAWGSLLFSSITAGVLRFRHREFVPWWIPAIVSFVAYPFVWVGIIART